MKGDGIYRCADCGLEGERDDFVPAADLGQRLEPGGLYSDVECPRCGALAFPVEAEPAVHRSEPVVVEVDPASVQKAVDAVEGAYRGIEERAVRFLLDGLGVPDIRELHRLVAEAGFQGERAGFLASGVGLARLRLRDESDRGPLPAGAARALEALDEAAAKASDLYDAAYPVPHAADN